MAWIYKYMMNDIENFKNTMATWDTYLLKEDKIQNFFDENELIFFFQKDGRLTFATMNDKKEDKRVRDEIRVLAINIVKSINDEKSESMFNMKEMKKIKILDRDEAEKILHKKIK
jgi:hypothetical protein